MLTLAQRAMRNCRGPCIQWNPPSEIFDHIAQVIANPYNFATAPSEIYTSGPLPARPDVAREPICVAEDPVAAYQFVEGSQ